MIAELRQPIALDSLPTRFHDLGQIKIWHTRRVIMDSATYQEAANRLGISKKALWEIRKRHNIEEAPVSPGEKPT